MLIASVGLCSPGINTPMQFYLKFGSRKTDLGMELKVLIEHL
jgi:hypothetical protein